MEQRSGLVLPEQHGFQLGGSWIPSLPAQPGLDRPGTAGGGQGNHPTVTGWFQSAAGFSSGAAGPVSLTERALDLTAGEVAVALPGGVSSCNANTIVQAQSMGGSIRGWHQTPHPNYTALMNAAATSSNLRSSLPMFFHGNLINGVEKSSSQLLLNGKVMLSSDLLNGTQYRSAALGTVAPPFAPVTPEKHKVAQGGGHPGCAVSVDEGETVRELLDPASSPLTFVQEGKGGPIQLCFDKGASERADFMSVGFPFQLEENETRGEVEKQGIDLNKTPQQKPQRKKHRPKVIKEGKPSRTPKSSTPKPATPKPSSTGENVLGKRKYVRRKGQNSPLETPSTAVARENVSGKRKYVRRKNLVSPLETPSSAVPGENVERGEREGTSSAKRCLDFSSEADKAAGTFQCNTNTRSQEQKESILGKSTCYSIENAVSDGKSTDMFNKGQDVALTSSAGIASILNLSDNEILGTYLNSLDIPSLYLQPSRREIIRENLKKLANKRDSQQVQNHEGITQPEAQTVCELTPAGQSASTNTSDLLSTKQLQNHEGITQPEAQTVCKLTPTGQSTSTNTSDLLSTNESMRRNDWKMNYNLFIDDTQLHSVNVVEADFYYDNTCHYDKKNEFSEFKIDRDNHVACFPEIQRKRTEKEHNELAFNSLSSFADAQRILELERLRAMEGKQAFGLIEVETMNGLKAPIQACNMAPLEDNMKCNQLPTALRNPILDDEIHENGIIQGPQDCIEPLEGYGCAKVGMKRRKKKEQNQAFSVMTSITNQVGMQEQNFALCTLRQKSGGSVASLASNSEPKDLQVVRVSTVQVSDSIRSSQETHKASYFSNNIFTYSYGNEVLHLIDIIVQKMRCLNISGDHGNNVIQEQTALVPYGAHGMIVPFEGYPTKKLRHRAKIVLDEETNRVWNLLMGKELNGVEGTEADKEKWWEEERRIFHGRADSFIARMHLVQGDRRFSPWKGSVLDSVIGVFLTQNVSDHLSSSAFMALAARFPTLSREKSGEANTSSEQLSSCTVDHDVSEKCSDKQACDKNSVMFYGSEQMEEKKMHPSGSDIGSDAFCHSKIIDLADTPLIVTEDRNIIKTNDQKAVEYINSSQNSVVSSQNSSDDPFLTIDQIASSSEINSEAEYLITSNQCCLETKTSFMELLEMAESTDFEELYISDNVKSCQMETYIPSENNQKHGQEISGERLHFPSPVASPVIETEILGTEGGPSTNATEVSYHQNSMLTSQSSPLGGSQAFANNLSALSLSTSSTKNGHRKHSYYHDGISGVTTESSVNIIFPNGSGLQNETSMEILLKQRRVNSHPTDIQIDSEALSYTQDCSGQQCHSGSPLKETPNVDKGKGASDKGGESNSTDEICSSSKEPMGSAGSAPRRKRGKLETEKNNSFDWDILRRQACQNGAKKERSSDTMDSLDWEAVRRADVSEISSTIRERGMNNKLAERIKGFLDRLVKEHGSIDLEWLRDVPPDKAKDYLLSIRGLGLKSVECVRLLTLHHLAFPVDTNVGRICVRLGWVPLQPLPESLQLHLLELYPMLETIQKYLWPRLCTLDQRTLYELHYQMITFGKVFCTKSKPNCNACPMRAECKHFASAFASARLALPGPEEKSLVVPSMEQAHKAVTNPRALPQLEGVSLVQEAHVTNICEPIIEEPATPEPECLQIPDIEDSFYEDPDEIPTIRLNIEEFAQNLQNYMQQNDMELQDVDLSKALVAITPEVASIPMPKLKNVSRLRTEHQVYELPDSHPLLEGLDQREAHDPCPYLLAIWTPGETAQSTELPESCCNAEGTGNLCDKSTCFSCNSRREVQTQIVRGTILIPCRTAMRGSFPLNGTYFQVNEVFADHESSLNPIDVPRALIWNLPRRTVYFGTSVPTIFRGLAIQEIQNCFWRGFVCVRGFDRKTRGPRPLMARLHFPASKANKVRGQQPKMSRPIQETETRRSN